MRQEKNHKKTYFLCVCALLSAIICMCTFISIPLPLGYFNLGDTAILLCVHIIGVQYGAVAASLGSVLADMLMGYALYIPATALIKPLCALLSYFLFRLLRRIFSSNAPPFFISALISEVFMTLGYFGYEYLALGYREAALASLVGNILQGVCCSICAAVFFAILKKRQK